MADYNRRSAEVNQYVADFVAWSLSQEETPVSGLDKTVGGLDATAPQLANDQMIANGSQERMQFQIQVPKYYVARNKHLNELVDAMDVLATSDDDFVSKWKQPLDALATDAQGTLGSLLSGIDKKTDKAVGLKWKISSEEELFVKALQGTGVAAKWMELRKIHRQLMNQIASLRTRWESIKGKAKEVNDSAMDAADRMSDQLHSAYEGGRSDYSNAFAAVDDARSCVDAITSQSSLSASSVGDGLQAAAGLMTKAGSTLSNMSGAYATALANLQGSLATLGGLQSAEMSGVQKIFKDVRTEITEYVREPASNRARALEQDGENMLASWVSSINQGAGMKGDASDFAQDVSRKPFLGLGAVLQNYTTFESENRGKFYEDLSGEVLDTLLFRDQWRDHSRWLLSGEASEYPTSVEASIAVYFSVPLEASYNNLIAAVPDKTDELMRETLKFKVASSRDLVLSQYRADSDGLRATLRSLVDLVKGPDFHKYLERANVLSNLKS